MFAGYPRQIKFIIGNEAGERFSFYGMRSILTVYLIQHLLRADYADLGQTQAAAKSVFHTFVMGVYFFPLLGGFLADRYLGKYKTILYLSWAYCLGHLCLALFDDHKGGFYTGLFLIALGAGGIKPCVSSFLGDQLDESNKHLSRQVFGLFYWIINFGSFFASLSIPLLLNKFGPKVAFGIPGVLMAVATLVFWLGRKQYVNLPPTPRPEHGFLAVLTSGLRAAPGGQKASFWERAAAEHPPEAIEAARAVLRLLPVFALISVFWAIFDQKASTVVIQGRHMEREIFGLHIAESQVQALNPLLVMLLVPLSQFLYPRLERAGMPLKPLNRMTLGVLLAGVAFAICGLIQLELDRGQVLNIAWQALPYLVLTLAEILVSTTGLEFSYSQAPLSVKGVIMSLFQLAVAVGNLLVVVITAVNVFSGAGQFFGYAILACFAALAFRGVARRYRGAEHFRSASA